MGNFVSENLDRIANNKWLRYTILVAALIIVVGNFIESSDSIWSKVSDVFVWVQSPSEQRAQLAERSERVARELMYLVNDRQMNEPEVDFENFRESSDSFNRYSQETINIYDYKYYDKVSNIRNEALRYGIKEEKLERYYRYPTNLLGLKDVARGLFDLSIKIQADSSQTGQEPRAPDDD